MQVILDDLHSSLGSNGFSRTRVDFSFPIYIYGVPGCGKTRLILGLLERNPNLGVETFGEPVGKSLAIEGTEEVGTSKKRYLFLDECQVQEFEDKRYIAVFGDRFQGERKLPDPHYTNFETKRFGKQTCSLLRSLGFEITSEKEDICEVQGLFEADLVGIAISADKGSDRLLEAHQNTDHLHIGQTRGKTFKEVSIIITDLNSIKKSDLFVGLTRHSEKLVIASDELEATSRS